MQLEKTTERLIPETHANREEYLIFLRHLFAYESIFDHIRDDDRVLEIGFGEGYGTCLLSDVADSVVGIEVNEQAVTHARRKYGSDNRRYKHYDGARFPFPNNSFDAALSFQVIEHIHEPVNFLLEAKRVLNDGGPLFLTTPNRTHRLEPGQKPWNKFHVTEYYPEEFRELLETVFDEVTVMGIYGRKEVQDIEYNRVDRKFSLYKSLPNFVKRMFFNHFEEKFNTDDFFLDEDPTHSLDLLAVCR